MTDKLLSEHHLEFLNLIGGYTGSSESILIKMPHCWKSHVIHIMYVKWNENGILMCVSFILAYKV